jgi:hypothetical protein
MTTKLLAALALSLSLTASAQDKKPIQLCAWMLETRDNFQNFELRMQADREFDFYYVIGGEGVVRESGKAHSPSSGVEVLHPGKPDRIWGWGTTPGGPAKIDITVEVHKRPADPLSEDRPLLTKFVFARVMPESEETPPPTLAKKQCVALKQ